MVILGEKTKNIFTKSIKFALLAIVIIYVLTNSALMFSGIIRGVEVSINVLIPSLYGFMIISAVITQTKLQNILAFPFEWVGKKIFKLDKELFSVYLLSLLGGYPIGAKLIAIKISEGKITAKTGEYMLNFCINCSPAFLITGVGVALLKNINLGVILYTSQVGASIVIGVILGVFQKNIHSVDKSENKSKKSLSEILVSSVNDMTKAMLTICSFVIAFWAFFPFVDILPIEEKFLFVIKGFLEVSYGCYEIISYSFSNEVLMICAFTAFGGICVIMQIAALISGSGIKLKYFLVSQVFYTLLSVIFCFGLLKLFPQVTDVFAMANEYVVKGYSVSPIASVFMIVLGILLLSFSKKHDRI